MLFSNLHSKKWDSSSSGGVLAILPSPYAELMRLHKPVGILNICFPYLFGILYAACISRPTIRADVLLPQMLWLFIDAFVLRSAGCVWNDVIDCDLDRLVQRTRLRPLARGAISLRAACLFTVFLAGIWLTILSRLLPEHWLNYAGPLVLFVFLYPFAKRVTNYPQVVLGVTLSWGVLIGAAILKLDETQMDKRARMGGLASLYSFYLVWTVIHDLVYAHQDAEDDIKAGIKSMAIPWLDSTKALVAGLAILQLGSLVIVGVHIDAEPLFYVTSVGGNAVTLVSMVWKLDLKDSHNCFWWFQTSSLLVGASVVAGLGIEYVRKSTVAGL